MKNIFNRIYDYRELLKTNVRKDIRGKYKRSILGILWSFINPLLQVVVYAIVFPHLFGATTQNYLVYLITGLIPWLFFQLTVSQGTIAIKANAGIIKKVYFPREILPLSMVISGLINFFISCIIIIIFCLIFGVGISWHLIYVPLIAVIESILILGIVLILSAVDVYIQDTEYIVQFILNMMMYGTPIIYDIAAFKGTGILHQLILLNPMTQLVFAYRNSFVYHVIPDMKMLGLVAIFSIVLTVIGYWIFQKLEKRFAEEL